MKWTYTLIILWATLFSSGLFSSLAQAAPFYFNVDQQTLPGGPVQLIFDSAIFSSGVQTIELNAKNTGAVNLIDVRYMFQFHHLSNGGPATSAMTFTNAGDTWSGGGHTLSVISPSGTMSISDTNAPLSWTENGFPATVAATDTVPYITIGNLGPGATQHFQVKLAVDANYPFIETSSFVSQTPEPGTFALVGFGAAGLLVVARGRRRK